MIYKTYGKTGKDVSAIGFGGMRFPAADLDDIEKNAELLLYAHEKGINYFDTAPGYCNDKSELIFGAAFKQMKNKKFYSSTKCGLWNAKSASDARKIIERSLERLNLDKITFYNLWCLKNQEEYAAFMKPDGVYEGVLQAHKEGLIEHVCFTTHMSSEDIKTVVDTGLFEGVTLGYNAVNFAYRQAGVDAAYAKNMGCVTMNPLGGGIIPQNPQHFSFIKQNESDSLAVAALKFLTSQPQVTVALVGFSNKEEIDESLKAADNLYNITPSFLDEQAKNLRNSLNALCTGCSYCDECPADVPIPQLMDSYNSYILSGNFKDVGSRLKDFWGLKTDAAAKCIECGQCEKACTQKLPIIQRLAEITQGQAQG